MRHVNSTRYFSIPATRIAVALTIIMLAAILPAKTISGQVLQPDKDRSGLPAVAAESFKNDMENNADDLCSINAIKRHLSRNIRYPQAAVEAGHYGTIELYARMNNEGRVNEVLELQPVRDYIDVDELVIVGYAPDGIETTESTRHSELIDESRRVIMSLPRCDIQEIFGQTLKFTFKFVLQ